MGRRSPSKRPGRRSRPTRRSQVLARLGFRKRGSQGRVKKRHNARKGAGHASGLGLKRVDPRALGSLFSSRQMLPALAAAVIVALGMAALRIDLIRGRYETGMDYSMEPRLGREIARLTARMRELRDPAHLGEAAGRLGFLPPERLIDLQLAPQPNTWDNWSATLQLASQRSEEVGRP